MFKGAKITRQGFDLLAKVIASNKPLQLTNMKIGDGTYQDNIENITDLVNIKLTEQIEELRNQSNVTIVRATFTNEKLPTGFHVREVGIYAMDLEKNKEVLYAYDNAGGGTDVDFLEPGSGVVVVKEVFEIATTFSNAKEVILSINPEQAYVTNDKFLDKMSELQTILDEKSEKIHSHFIHDISNILFEIRDNSAAGTGKYTRIMESVLQNKENSGAYARYQVQFDYSDYFEIDIAVQQDKLLTEEVPKIELSSYNCPDWVGVYATVQSDPDWQIYDIDLYLKMDKSFTKMKLRQLSQNGDTSVLTYYDAYKVVDRLEDRQNLIKIIEAKKYISLSMEEKEALQNIQLTDSKISVTDVENYFTGTKLDEVLNELFMYASNGKLAITTVAGLANNSTFQAIANELAEWKRLVAEAGGISAANENMRTQAAKIVEYVRTNLPNIITNNGGSLINSTGAGVTAGTSTLDTIYHSINNLATTKNNQITAMTNEKNQWHQNYLNMEADRNSWMNLANSKKSVQMGSVMSRLKAPWYNYYVGKWQNVSELDACYFDINFGTPPSYLFVKSGDAYRGWTSIIPYVPNDDSGAFPSNESTNIRGNITPTGFAVYGLKNLRSMTGMISVTGAIWFMDQACNNPISNTDYGRHTLQSQIEYIAIF